MYKWLLAELKSRGLSRGCRRLLILAKPPTLGLQTAGGISRSMTSNLSARLRRPHLVVLRANALQSEPLARCCGDRLDLRSLFIRIRPACPSRRSAGPVLRLPCSCTRSQDHMAICPRRRRSAPSAPASNQSRLGPGGRPRALDCSPPRAIQEPAMPGDRRRPWSRCLTVALIMP